MYILMHTIHNYDFVFPLQFGRHIITIRVHTHALLSSAGQDYNTISFRTNREDRHIAIAKWLESSREPCSFDVLRPILFDLLKRRETWDDTVEMLNFCIEQKGLQKELGRISTKQLFAVLYQAFCIRGCKVGCKLEKTNEEMNVRKNSIYMYEILMDHSLASMLRSQWVMNDVDFFAGDTSRPHISIFPRNGRSSDFGFPPIQLQCHFEAVLETWFQYFGWTYTILASRKHRSWSPLSGRWSELEIQDPQRVCICPPCSIDLSTVVWRLDAGLVQRERGDLKCFRWKHLHSVSGNRQMPTSMRNLAWRCFKDSCFDRLGLGQTYVGSHALQSA